MGSMNPHICSSRPWYFNAFLQAGNPQSRQRLVNQLEKLNGFLESENERYVTKDSITYGDCYLMPRLHHLKVASKEYLEFEIPENLFFVWRYLYHAYNTQAFLETCPTDQDIVKHYEKKAKQFKPKKGVPSLQKETFSYDIPQSVLDRIESQGGRRETTEEYDASYGNDDQIDHQRYPDPPETADNDAGYSEPGNGEIEYENIGHINNDDNGYGDADLATNEPMQAASPERSASPTPDATYEDPDTFRTADEAVDTSSPQRSASPVAGSPQRSGSPEPMAEDGSPSAPQTEEDTLYENYDSHIETKDSSEKSEFAVTPDENENEAHAVEQEYDQVTPKVHVNGTNSTEHN